MTYALAPFQRINLDERLLMLLIDEHESTALPRLMRLWRYYRNALAEPTDNGGSAGAPAQRSGLPPRLINADESLQPEPRFRREIVIENDIAWRIHALVDFMFPAMPRLVSQARGARAQEIQAILNAIFDANGGIALWQNAALLGSVYGHVDFLLNCNGLSSLVSRPSADRRTPIAESHTSPGVAPSKPSFEDLIDRVRSTVLIETIEAPRAISLLSRNDYRVLDAYIVHFAQPIHDVEEERWLTRLLRAMRRTGSIATTRRAIVTITEIHSDASSQRYEDGVLVTESINRLGRIPVVHIQNLSQPLRFEGLSDVEPLIPLQDELNTRLSDRANRVTMQSFRMWLGKGIENFDELPVGPGQMWSTDNPEADIESFGGDADSPSERQHLEDLRERWIGPAA